MLPPLKAVMVALSVLIQNYDVCPSQHLVPPISDRLLQRTAANADQIGEIEERVRSLGGILARPVDDQDSEEKARRRALRRFVILIREIPVHHSITSIIQQGIGQNRCKAPTAF